MNENFELFDEAIDAAAKELMADAPETLLKSVMYRIEKDEKPQRFAFGRFTAIAAAAAAVILTVSLGGKYLGGSTSADNAAPAAMLESVDSTAGDTGGEVEMFLAGGADTHAYGVFDYSTAVSEESGTENKASDDTADSNLQFAEPRMQLTPVQDVLYEYIGGKTVLDITWETELIAVVELELDGNTEKIRYTIEDSSGVYKVVKEEKLGDAN